MVAPEELEEELVPGDSGDSGKILKNTRPANRTFGLPESPLGPFPCPRGSNWLYLPSANRHRSLKIRSKSADWTHFPRRQGPSVIHQVRCAEAMLTRSRTAGPAGSCRGGRRRHGLPPGASPRRSGRPPRIPRRPPIESGALASSRRGRAARAISSGSPGGRRGAAPGWPRLPEAFSPFWLSGSPSPLRPRGAG